MSLFQCSKCGCLENTALTGGYLMRHYLERPVGGVDSEPTVAHSYRLVLGLKPDEPFGAYCSACNPVWYTESGHYGVGPRPPDYARTARHRDDAGVWHGEFERCYFRKGLFHTDENGNLSHIETLEDCHKYQIPSEDDQPPAWPRFEGRLPRPGTPPAAIWIKKMDELLLAGRPKNMDTIDEVWEAAFAEENARIRAQEQQMRKRRRNSMMAMASVAGLAAAAGMPRREPPPPREKTPEELELEAKRSAEKIAAAQAKRDRKAAKRRAQVVT